MLASFFSGSTATATTTSAKIVPGDVEHLQETHHRSRLTSIPDHNSLAATTSSGNSGSGKDPISSAKISMKHHASDANISSLPLAEIHIIDRFVLKVPYLYRLLELLTFRRVAYLVVGIYALISGLGTTSYWVLKWSGNEQFVPFGLSTFRSLQWETADMVLLFSCFFAAYNFILMKTTDYMKLAGLLFGALFVVMGFLGLYIENSKTWKELLVGGDARKELQPFALNIWFIIWGSLVLWLNFFGFDFLDSLRRKPLFPWE